MTRLLFPQDCDGNAIPSKNGPGSTVVKNAAFNWQSFP